MKATRLTFLFACLLALAACGDDDDPIIINHGGSSTPIDTGKSANSNRNTSGPAEAQTRYEFPKLKGGNSVVIVHEAKLNKFSDEAGVNYSLEWDHQKQATRWVCYQVYNTVRASNWTRPKEDPWAYDPDVPQEEQQSTYNELSKSNPPLPNSTYYEKGHIIASADRLSSQEVNTQTFYMTNIYPMVHDFNGGIWANMESRVRTWGNQADTLYVCKGGTIDSESRILDRTIRNHIVPKYFYMAVFSKQGTKTKALGFWIEHKDGDAWDDLKAYAVSIDRLEELTGIDFFCNLPDDIEDQAEATLTLSDWGLK